MSSINSLQALSSRTAFIVRLPLCLRIKHNKSINIKLNSLFYVSLLISRVSLILCWQYKNTSFKLSSNVLSVYLINFLEVSSSQSKNLFNLMQLALILFYRNWAERSKKYWVYWFSTLRMVVIEWNYFLILYSLMSFS